MAGASARAAGGRSAPAHPYRAGVSLDEARRCPICARALEANRVHGPEIVVDACREHGTFFDPFELHALEQHYAIRGAELAMDIDVVCRAFVEARTRGRR